MTRPTFFQTGPQTVVPVRRVYDADKPLYPEKDDGFKTPKPKSNSIINPGNAGNALKAIKPDKSGNLSISRLDALKQVSSATSNLGNPIDQLTPAQQQATLSNLGVEQNSPGADIINASSNTSARARRIINKIAGTVNIGTTKRLIHNGDINSVNGVVGVINELANGNVLQVEDFTSKMSIVRGVISDLAKYGILDSIDYVLQTMSDIRSKKRLLTKMVPMFFISADIANLNMAIKTLGAGRVMAIYPQGIAAFCSGFRFHWTTKPTQYKKFRNQIIQLFNKLDPQWNIYTRNGTTINNYEALTYMSSHFYTLFSHFDGATIDDDIFPGSGQTKAVQATRFSTMVLTAKNFPSVDLQRFLTTRYPKASFTFRR